jgi:hypothetical protein
MTTAELMTEAKQLTRSERSTLEREVRRSRKVYDMRECSKSDLAWLILEAKHGRKLLNSLLGH